MYYLDREGHYYHLDVVKAVFGMKGADNIKSINPESGYFCKPIAPEGSYKGISNIETVKYIDIEAKAVRDD